MDDGFVPVALGCGHVVVGMAKFEHTPGEGTKVDCPEGCGWQSYVVEPGEEDGCLCENPLAHVCGRTAQVIDLGYLEEGDVIEVHLEEDGDA